MKKSRQAATEPSEADWQAVLRTRFGPIWLANVLQGKSARTGTAVFVEGDTLQYWAKKELGAELDADEIRQLITPHIDEPFEIQYYVEIGSAEDEKAVKRLVTDGLRLRIVDRRGPWPAHHAEDHLEADARDILPLLKHLVLVCGQARGAFVPLLQNAKNKGCRITVLSAVGSKKLWGIVDDLVPLSTAWAERQETPMKTHNRPDLSDRPRVVILPIRPDEEKAILTRVKLEKEPFVGKHGTYKLARIRRRRGSLLVAIKRIMEQGNLSAQDAARNAVEDLDPDWIVLIGIGGGVPANEYTLGDVMVATRVHDFSVGAYKERGRPQVELTNQGGPMNRKAQDLIDQIPHLEQAHAGWNTKKQIKAKRPPVDLSDSQFYGNDKWKKSANASLDFHFNAERRKFPLFWPVPFGGDSFLIKDTRVVSEWRKHARDIGLFEMELPGVYAAARRLEKEYPILCIRGISDIVGFERDSGWTAYACNSAGAFCVWLLKHMHERYFGS
jgi:nucleoside phosphorylase